MHRTSPQDDPSLWQNLCHERRSGCRIRYSNGSLWQGRYLQEYVWSKLNQEGGLGSIVEEIWGCPYDFVALSAGGGPRLPQLYAFMSTKTCIVRTLPMYLTQRPGKEKETLKAFWNNVCPSTAQNIMIVKYELSTKSIVNLLDHKIILFSVLYICQRGWDIVEQSEAFLVRWPCAEALAKLDSTNVEFRQAS